MKEKTYMITEDGSLVLFDKRDFAETNTAITPTAAYSSPKYPYWRGAIACELSKRL